MSCVSLPSLPAIVRALGCLFGGLQTHPFGSHLQARPPGTIDAGIIFRHSFLVRVGSADMLSSYYPVVRKAHSLSERHSSSGLML
jgi:hypothetical protein